jgi:hypothetical protein
VTARAGDAVDRLAALLLALIRRRERCAEEPDREPIADELPSSWYLT